MTQVIRFLALLWKTWIECLAYGRPGSSAWHMAMTQAFSGHFRDLETEQALGVLSLLKDLFVFAS